MDNPPFSILVVDDDEPNREGLRRRLDRRGYATDVAVDGLDALAKVAANGFDLVILDVMMPGMSGLEVLDALRKTHPPTQLPVIMATAQDTSADVVYALDHGANDYVTKPLDFAVVQARVRTQLELKRSVDQVLQLEHSLSIRNAELESVNDKLRRSAARTARELESAARVQKAFLPPADPMMAGARFSWLFEPCTELAGDALNVIRLDADHVAFYVLDVSGHGVAASLLAVAATRMLSLSGSDDSMLLTTAADGSRAPTSPADVATRLNAQFAFDSESGQFLTLFYAVLNLRTRTLSYVSAGHPGAVRVDPDGRTTFLNGGGAVIGLGTTFDPQQVILEPGTRVYLYSDGVTECRAEDDSLYGIERFVETIAAALESPLSDSLARIGGELTAWRGKARSRDDVSVVAVECARGQ